MAHASPARITALHLLGAQRRRHARARDLMRGAREMDTLGRKGRALATRLVLGVNVASGELDRRIDSFSSRPGSIEPRVRDALRLAAFELLYLDTPRQVAVSQGVELVRGVQPRAARMANAVLRRIADCRPEVDEAREKVALLAAVAERAVEGSPVGSTAASEPSVEVAHEISAEAETHGMSEDADGPSANRGADVELSVGELSLASGYPAWLVERLLGSLSPERVAAMCACALEPAPVYVTAGKGDGDGLEKKLVDAGLAPMPAELAGCWRLGATSKLARSGLVASCDVAVADLAAQLACRAAASKGRVLEVGQGRGTKSLMLARLARELGCEADVTGCELVTSKVDLSAKRMEQAGLAGCVSCVEFDGTKLGCEGELPEELAGQFDSVLVDAPCSGTGTMRRHPETAWALDEVLCGQGEHGLPALQLRLLTAASGRVALGGQLVYATCSVLCAENAEVVEAFLASEAGQGFERASLLEAPAIASCESAAAIVEANLTPAGDFQSSPVQASFDGHFFARLVRKA